MSKPKQEFFSNRLGVILSMLGVAVGAGNIWRFSRIVAQNGGGSFIIPWVIFLFVWSIPLIIAEIALGKNTRKAPIGALAKSSGPQFAWMGGFIALVTTGIMCYYSVVVGWGLRYFLYALQGTLESTNNYTALWDNFSHSYQPLFFHAITIIIASFIVYKGITKGIELSNKILIPLLILIIITIFIRAITLPGAFEGIKYLFTPTKAELFSLHTWLEALTQNAWDTGAGWGLLLVYAGYMKKKESITINGCLTAFSNNAISLIMAMTLFSAIFAFEGTISSLTTGEGSSNIGITFIYLPKLLRNLPGGPLVHSTFATLFFLAFFSAALSSLVSMIQVTMQTIKELGVRQHHALFITGLIALCFGTPSALNMHVFDNQDWVWGLGLILNGLFISFAIIKYGTNKFRKEIINYSPHDFNLGKFYNLVISCLIPAQAIVLIGWYFYVSIFQLDRELWWDPFREFSLGTILLQWGLGLMLCIIYNKWMVKRTIKFE